MKYITSTLSYFWNHKKISIGVLVVLFLLFLFRPKTPPVVPTQTITKGTFTQSLSVSGNVNATTIANLTFPISGKIVYIGAKKGDMVKQYQTIASLDERTIEDNLQSAIAAANSQQQSFNNVNDQNGDRALTDTGLSVSAFRQLQTAANSLTQAQLAVDIQNIAKEQAYLISPINGILTRADITTPGIVASLTTTYTVVDPTSTVFDMDVDEADIGNVHLGQMVNITFDAYPNETLHQPITKIDFVSHTTSNGSNAFTVETQLPNNTSYKYRLGMNANADIILDSKGNVLTVPLSAVASDNTVWVKVPGGYGKKTLQLGEESDTDAEVISGLQEGDVVALDPNAASLQNVTAHKKLFGIF